MQNDPSIGPIVFSRRFWQPAATIAEILNCSGNSCVVIDVDLQDPPEVIADLHKKYREGYDVVGLLRIPQLIFSKSLNYFVATKASWSYVLRAFAAYLAALFYQQNNKIRMSFEPKQMEMICLEPVLSL